jgi:hypothetical protein
MPIESPHIRARRLAVLERDVASAVACAELYELSYNGGLEQKVLKTRIAGAVSRIDTGLGSLFEIINGDACGDNLFIPELRADYQSIASLVDGIMGAKTRSLSNELNLKRLNIICTEFNHHLRSLREFYETFTPPWTE